ncbi:MAG: PqqD family protein [Vicinamibacterales bacterium]
MQSSLKPLARTEGLVVHEMPGELLVYDVNSDKAHCLNATSASVWKACDGENTVADLSALFHADAGSAHAEGVVLLALDQFQQNNLLQNPVNLGPSYSRRDLIRTIGLTSLMVLPGVATLAMPKAPQASCQCLNPGACLVQTSCPSTVNCNGSGVCAP